MIKFESSGDFEQMILDLVWRCLTVPGMIFGSQIYNKMMEYFLNQNLLIELNALEKNLKNKVHLYEVKLWLSQGMLLIDAVEIQLYYVEL